MFSHVGQVNVSGLPVTIQIKRGVADADSAGQQVNVARVDLSIAVES